MTIDYLKVRGPAEEIARCAIVAYYLEGSGASDPWVISQKRDIDRNFADLANALGYRVEPLDDLNTPESIAAYAADQARSLHNV